VTGHALVLASAGRSSDAGFLAAADLASIAADLVVPYRLVGGNAVTLLCAVHGVTDLVPARETADADFGADYQVVGDARLQSALLARGYRQVEGNRFSREQTGTGADGRTETWPLVVDVLAPSYEGRLLSNRRHGDLVVDEIPGLALALSRAGVDVDIEVRLTSGHELRFSTTLPDAVSALCLKAYAYVGRFSDRDAVDIWRLLEAARAAGVTTATWPAKATGREAGAALWQHFGRPGAAGASRASSRPADQTRIRALVAAVVGTPP
jgi:hypothetical protein